MRSPSDDPLLCALCQEAAATETYTHKALDALVCADCLERQTVRDALEDNLRHIIALECRRQYDEALACLEAILEANRHRDHDRWLARSIAMHRASILFDAGRYPEAEQAHHEWAQSGFIDVWRRQMHALGLAKTLEALDRDREAMAALEDALGHEDRKDLPLALTVLAELARLSDKLALPVDAKWLRLAEAAAECYVVDMPVGDSPGQIILALQKITRSMQPKRPSG